MMRLQLKGTPFTEPVTDKLLTERATILSIIETSNDVSWAKENLHVRLNGINVPPCWWPYVTVKPEADGLLALTIVQDKSPVARLVASVALIALTAGIGTFGVPFLGAGFLAGSFGASAIAAGVGLAGQLAINALTAPPSLRQSNDTARTFGSAGVSSNSIDPMGLLATVHGRVLVSPDVIAPSYVTRDGEIETVHVIVGCQGRNLVEDVQVNSTPIELLSGIQYETREGAPGDLPLTLCQLTCIQKSTPILITNFNLKSENAYFDELVHQDDPDSDLPKQHVLSTNGDADEVWLEFVMPSGMVNTADGAQAGLSLRVEIKLKSSSTWLKLPVSHISDIRKGNGPMKFWIKLKWMKQPSGRHFSQALGEWPVYEINNNTAPGQTFEYESEAYFKNTGYTINNDDLPIMSAATTSLFTQSASSELVAGTTAAWRASDGSFSAAWQPANNSLPAWHKTQVPTARTYRSYTLNFTNTDVVATTAATKWFVEGSLNNVDWTRLDDEDVDISQFVLNKGDYQIGNPGSYLYYRITFLANNGAANQQITVIDLQYHFNDAPGITTTVDGLSGTVGQVARHATTLDARSVYGSLDKNGATFFLDPATFPKGEYDFRVQRGAAYKYVDLELTAYEYETAPFRSFFHTYSTVGGVSTIFAGQKNYRSDLTMERFSTVSYDSPVDTSGITCIAIEMENTKIESLAAWLTSYARVWDAGLGIWSVDETPTSNPSALYRRLVMGHAHPNPPATELLNDHLFIDWYNRCVTAGYECNYVQKGQTVAEVKGVMSYCGYASPQESEMIGIIEDYDRSPTGTDEEISQTLSPLNSRLIGEVIPFPDIEHAILAEYLDEDDSMKLKRIIIYRDGYTLLNATIFQTIRYDGITTAAAVTARATFDMRQAILRAATVQVEVDIEGFTFWRGKLVGHSDDVIDGHNHYGLITAVTTVGPNITSITVNNVVPFSEIANDLDVLLEGIDPLNPAGVAIRKSNGQSVVKTLSNVVDGNVATFTTPFPSAGSGIAVGQLAVFGVAGREFRRMLVMGSKPSGNSKRVLSLAPEAPELFQ